MRLDEDCESGSTILPEDSDLDSSLIPDEVVRVYSSIPHRIQELINEAGLEAKQNGEELELKVTELKNLTYLTPDDVYYSSLLAARGEPPREIVKQLLTRAEHLVNGTSHLSSPRKVNDITTSLNRSSASRAMGQVPSIAEISTTSRRTSKKRSLSAKLTTRAYQKAATEHHLFRELTKDKSTLDHDAIRLGLQPTRFSTAPSRSRSVSNSPSPALLGRLEATGRYNPGTISGKLVSARSTNAAHSLRSRTARMMTAKEPCTMSQYTIPGMVDVMRLRNKGKTNRVAFGSSTPAASGYLPHEVQGKLTSQKKQQRHAKLTAASHQDADTLIKNAQRYKSPSPSVQRRGTYRIPA